MNLKAGMAITAILILGGCGRHDSPPASEVTTDDVASAAGGSTIAGREAWFDADALAEEAKAIATCGQVERDGDILKLKSVGKVVATLRDQPDNAWRLTHCFEALADEGMTMKYFVVEDVQEIEISRSSLIVDQNGAPIGWIPSTVEIYKGPLIAGGYIGEDAGAFVIMDWSRPRHVHYRFETPCYPEAWRSDSQLSAKCGFVYQDAAATTIVKTGPSTWRALPNGKPVDAEADQPFSAEVLASLAEDGFTQAK